jgi:hypothetical protein
MEAECLPEKQAELRVLRLQKRVREPVGKSRFDGWPVVGRMPLRGSFGDERYGLRRSAAEEFGELA